jgi:hypothetical protein
LGQISKIFVPTLILKNVEKYKSKAILIFEFLITFETLF